MNIKFQQHIYQALLAEANRQDKPLARLCNEILETAASIFDNSLTLPSKGNLQGVTYEQEES
ncbi:hypothetical protein [Edwardsiella tarda]|uniref:hypothetical protein n=1 Tax=Edwardsiella tarda TaxID=636 RepID=UPI0009458A28|nr:hypothetical protein [Edwardsiella tarda]